jgi:hypothetical protein
LKFHPLVLLLIRTHLNNLPFFCPLIHILPDQ